MRLVLCLLTMFVMSAKAMPYITNVTARQRYPWNGLVDIDYTIVGESTGCQLDISVKDLMTGSTYIPTKFLSEKVVAEGVHRLTWSTEAEGITIISTNVSFKLSLIRGLVPDQTNETYYVIDLSSGPNALNYPVTMISAVPGGVWSDEFKTTKLVLRRLEPGSIPSRAARITKPFFIGVFEVTQKQYELIMGNNPSKDDTLGDTRPVNRVSYEAIRGGYNGVGWPRTSDVDEKTVLWNLRTKTGILFDFPTEAQWEYACRAGTDSKVNNGGNSDADLVIVGRCSLNCNDGRGGFSKATVVGSYAPNNWGLYDMHGNVSEWCLDWRGAEWTIVGDDPVGATWGRYRVVRGGNWSDDMFRCDSSYMMENVPDGCGSEVDGFRLACPVGP